MLRLAWRNLLHDKVRLVVTLAGIVFAVVLMVVELGLFVGFTRATSSIIDNSKADLWITSKNVPYIEVGVPFNERRLYQARTVPGVRDVERFISRWSAWKHPDGRDESIQVIGFEPGSTLAGPWNLVAGSVDDLRIADGVLVDELYREKLGVNRVGEVFEINGRRAKVVGFTRGIRAFTTAPYVFTTFKRAQDYTRLSADQTMYGLVQVAPGADVGAVRRGILGALPDVNVVTVPEFSSMTRAYWMFTTGAGLALLIAAALGLVVGFVVVAQTIYATTMERQREFGTLKALGAPNAYVYKVIVQQAVLSAGAGYPLGMLLSLALIGLGGQGGASIDLPWELALLMFVVTMAMCVGAAMVSIHKVTRLDPAMVFRG